MKTKKKEKRKLSLKDHILYFFSYVLLTPLFLPLPWVVFIRNKLFLHSSKALALSNGYGLLWTILCMFLVAILAGYLSLCENKKIPFLDSMKNILHNKLKLFILVFCVVGILVSLGFSVASGRVVLTDEQIIRYNMFGLKTSAFDIEDVDKVEFAFTSSYASNGRYGKNIVSLSYCVYINDDRVEFDSYAIQDLLLIDQLFVEKPHVITNEFYLDRWLASLNCSQEIKSNIEMFFKK